jgi:hypothetical protein
MLKSAIITIYTVVSPVNFVNYRAGEKETDYGKFDRQRRGCIEILDARTRDGI